MLSAALAGLNAPWMMRVLAAAEHGGLLSIALDAALLARVLSARAGAMLDAEMALRD